MILPRHLQRRCDDISERARRVGDVAGVFDVASPRLRQMVAFDKAMWVATDPATSLPAAPPRLDDITDRADCRSYWHHEFLSDDVNQFHDLARSPVPVATLVDRTAGDLARSARYRRFLGPEVGDELRAVLRVGDISWGMVTLYREAGRPAFSPRDAAIVARLSVPLASALRANTTTDPQWWAPSDLARGVLMFGPGGELVSVNDAAHRWLADLPAGQPGAAHQVSLPPAHRLATGRGDLSPGDGAGLPTWLVGTVVRARAIAEGRQSPGAWSRVRSRSGRWLVCHASCLRDTGGSGAITGTVLVIEPARPAELAPVIVEAYGLSEREQQVTSLIARGASTGEMADELFLSPHTVRDHVKAVFEKVQVSSRGELVAKLFAEHYLPADAPARTA